MTSRSLTSALARRNVHYGWVVAAVTFLTMLITAGTIGAPGVFIVPLEREFGWMTSEISSALALRFLLYGLMGPFAAVLMNRFGVRRIVLLALGILTVTLVTSLAMTSVSQLILLWGVGLGIGTGLTAMVLGATVATQWFSERRGLAMGLLSASTATGQLVFLPLLASLTEAYGWRIIGLAPYGATDIVPHVRPSGGLGELLASPVLVLMDAMKSGAFWVLFGTFFICGLSTSGLIQTHFIALCGDFGLAPVKAASVLALMGVFDFFGTIGSGWLSDRFDNRGLLFWYYGLRGLSLIYLPFTDFTFYGLSLFAMFYGLDWIATVPPTVKLTSRYFGAERTNVVFGWIFAGHQLGAAAAAYGAGLTRTEWSTYLPAFFIAGAACLVAALFALSLGKPGRTAVSSTAAFEPDPV
ncbi:MAG: MFS transporter [Hyphomicrobium denitrificans]|nr:MFS transporter [Hyphomicrobium denitrificans]